MKKATLLFTLLLLAAFVLMICGCASKPAAPVNAEKAGDAPSAVPQESAAPAAPDEPEETDPHAKVYTCTYLWGENADEEYTWTIILHEPESPVSETNGATGFVFEGVTYEIKDPGPYFEEACGELPLTGRLWKNDIEEYWFFGGEEGPEDSSGPCLLWRENGSFSFTVSPAVSYTLTFSPKE